MSTPESLHLTTLRIAAETSIGSGSPAGSIYRPPMTAAACQREIQTMAERRNLARGPSQRAIIAQSWSLATSHEIGLPFLRLILASHMTTRAAGEYTLDPEAPEPTWVIETESAAGDLARFTGAAVEEIRIAIDERSVARMDLKWRALQRLVPDTAMTGPEGDSLAGELITTQACGFAATSDEWDLDPRVDNAAVMHGGQLYLTRRILPANFDPNGRPHLHDRAPWDVLGEVYMPETPGITDQAFDGLWQGRVAIWIGAGATRVQIENASGYVADEDLLAYDWRTRRLAFTGQADDRRALLDFFA